MLGVGLGGPDVELDIKHMQSYDVIALFEKYGRFDVLINNAATMILNEIEEYSPVDFMISLNTNLVAPFTIMRQFILAHQGMACRIINTTSMCVKTPSTRCPGYVASKAGLDALTRALARELALTNFIFCNIAPNVVDDTPMTEQGLHSLVKKRCFTKVEADKYMTPPIGRRISHEEIYKVFKFAVEEMPRAMTGTTLYIPAGTGI